MEYTTSSMISDSVRSCTGIKLSSLHRGAIGFRFIGDKFSGVVFSDTQEYKLCLVKGSCSCLKSGFCSHLYCAAAGCEYSLDRLLLSINLRDFKNENQGRIPISRIMNSDSVSLARDNSAIPIALIDDLLSYRERRTYYSIQNLWSARNSIFTVYHWSLAIQKLSVSESPNLQTIALSDHVRITMLDETVIVAIILQDVCFPCMNHPVVPFRNSDDTVMRSIMKGDICFPNYSVKNDDVIGESLCSIKSIDYLNARFSKSISFLAEVHQMKVDSCSCLRNDYDQKQNVPDLQIMRYNLNSSLLSVDTGPMQGVDELTRIPNVSMFITAQSRYSAYLWLCEYLTTPLERLFVVASESCERIFTSAGIFVCTSDLGDRIRQEATVRSLWPEYRVFSGSCINGDVLNWLWSLADFVAPAALTRAFRALGLDGSNGGSHLLPPLTPGIIRSEIIKPEVSVDVWMYYTYSMVALRPELHLSVLSNIEKEGSFFTAGFISQLSDSGLPYVWSKFYVEQDVINKLWPGKLYHHCSDVNALRAMKFLTVIDPTELVRLSRTAMNLTHHSDMDFLTLAARVFANFAEPLVAMQFVCVIDGLKITLSEFLPDAIPCLAHHELLFGPPVLRSIIREVSQMNDAQLLSTRLSRLALGSNDFATLAGCFRMAPFSKFHYYHYVGAFCMNVRNFKCLRSRVIHSIELHPSLGSPELGSLENIFSGICLNIGFSGWDRVVSPDNVIAIVLYDVSINEEQITEGQPVIIGVATQVLILSAAPGLLYEFSTNELSTAPVFVPNDEPTRSFLSTVYAGENFLLSSNHLSLCGTRIRISDKCIVTSIRPSNPHRNYATGRQGEEKMYSQLQAEYSDCYVEWSNEYCESGRPYDFIVYDDISKHKILLYIEVKTTARDATYFYLSYNEYTFCQLHGSRYQIYFVIHNADGCVVRNRFSNIVKCFKNQDVKICVYV